MSLSSDVISSLWLTPILIASFAVQGQGSSKGMLAGLTPPSRGPPQGQPVTQPQWPPTSSALLNGCQSCTQPWHHLLPLQQLPVWKVYATNSWQALTKHQLFLLSLPVPISLEMSIKKGQEQGWFPIRKELMCKTKISEKLTTFCEVRHELQRPAAK